MAVLEGREVGKGSIGLFVHIRCFDWVGFGVPLDRKGIAQFRRVKAQVNVRLDGEDFNLRHLAHDMIGIRGR